MLEMKNNHIYMAQNDRIFALEKTRIEKDISEDQYLSVRHQTLPEEPAIFFGVYITYYNFQPNIL
jgi:hypothetical protein